MNNKKGYYKSSVYQESIRSLRTNIEFTNIDNDNKAIVITSAKSSEGKSNIIYDLAKAFAQNDNSVVLVDCDLRNPQIGKISGYGDNLGLTNVVTGKIDINDALKKDKNEEKLFLLTSGPVPPNPAELLASNKVKKIIDTLKFNFDYVFIDSPPVGFFTDAAILSQLADGVIFAIKSNETKVVEVESAIDNLKKVEANILGAILTFADVKYSKYRNYYHND